MLRSRAADGRHRNARGAGASPQPAGMAASDCHTRRPPAARVKVFRRGPRRAASAWRDLGPRWKTSQGGSRGGLGGVHGERAQRVVAGVGLGSGSCPWCASGWAVSWQGLRGNGRRGRSLCRRGGAPWAGGTCGIGRSPRLMRWSFQRKATAPASAPTGRLFGIATRWVSRPRQASTASGPPNGGLASCRRRACGTMTTHPELRNGASEAAKAPPSASMVCTPKKGRAPARWRAGSPSMTRRRNRRESTRTYGIKGDRGPSGAAQAPGRPGGRAPISCRGATGRRPGRSGGCVDGASSRQRRAFGTTPSPSYAARWSRRPARPCARGRPRWS